MKRIFILLLSLSILLFAGCSSVDIDEVKGFSDSMVEDMLQALNNDDYDGFIKDFGPEMKDAFDENTYNQQIKTQIIDVIGQYQSKELLKASFKSSNGTKFLQTIYQAKYSDEPEDVVITVVFSNDLDNRTIEGLFFSSPKIIESAK